MRYLHPDVLDNGSAHIMLNAARAVLIPFFTANYAQVNSTALASAVISQGDFTLSDEGTGRKLVFGGVIAPSSVGIAASSTLHVAYTDGAARVLWVEPIRPAIILGGQNYRLPPQMLVSPQPIAAL